MFARAFDKRTLTHFKPANGQPLPDNDSRTKRKKAAMPSLTLENIVADELRTNNLLKRERDDHDDEIITLGNRPHTHMVTHLLGPVRKKRFYGK